MAITKSLRGADLRVFINGRIYPWAIAVRWSATTGSHAIGGIDQHTPFELAVGQTTIKGTMDVCRIRNTGGLEGSGIVPTEQNMLLGKYFSLALVDRLSDTVILQIDEAFVTDQNWQTQPRGLLTGAFSFEGIAWTNEA